MLIFALENYNAAVGAPPSGDSRAIFRALYGENPKGEVFLENPHGGAGKLLDPWQNPYDIEILSGNVVRVRSAGRNGKLGDDDDIELVTELGKK
jgi:hypothetical protein